MSTPNDDQIERWNTVTGQTWAELQSELDTLLQPLGLEAVCALAPTAGEHIADIGCGCGQSSLELAERVGPRGRVTGIDVSAPMLEVARGRSPSDAVTFRRLDAQGESLGAAVFEAAYSRFGVMFFSDPEAAFANISAALKPGGRLAFVCWRSFAENLWMSEPWEAALPFLPPQAHADPAAPGPFAFADADRVRTILAAAGFGAVTVRPFDLAIGGADVDDTARLALRVGPLAGALREAPEAREQVAAAVKVRLASHLTETGVRMAAAVWIVTSAKP